MNGKQIFGLISGIGTILTVGVAMVWGVPFYVDSRVEARLAQLNAAAGTPPEVSALQTEMGVVSTKVDTAIAVGNANGQKLDSLAQNVMDVYREMARLGQ